MRAHPRHTLSLFFAALLAVALGGCDDPAPSDGDVQGDAGDAFDSDSRSPDTTTDTRRDAPDDVEPSKDATLVRFSGGTVVIEEDPFRWRVDANVVGVTRIRTTSALPFVSVETASAGAEEPFRDPRPALGVPPQLWEVVSIEQDATYQPATFTLRDPAAPDAGTLTVAFNPIELDRSLEIDVAYEPGEESARRIELTWQDDGGPLYGGGERFTSLDARGQLIPLFLAEDPFDATGTNRAHVPIPFLLNIQGYGVFFETTRAGAFDLGRDDPFTLRARFDASALSVRLWVGGDPFRNLERFVEYTGLPTPPPTWSLAPHFGRPGARTSEAILEDAATLRRLGVPAGVMQIDAPWYSAQGDFSFNDALHPDPAGLLGALRAMGFDAVLTVSPYLGTSDDSDLGLDPDRSQALFDEAASDGHLVTDPSSAALDIPWAEQRTAGIVDFTSPDAVDWWASLAQPTLDLGVRGFRLDGGENIWVPPQGSPDLEYRFSDGRSERDLHRLYSNLYHEAFADLFADAGVDGFICGRAGTWGVQQGAGCIWPPALTASFDAPFGLRDAVRAALNLSLSGVPFFGSEIGGAPSALPTPELLVRWAAFGVFNTTMTFLRDVAPWEAPYTERTFEIIRAFAGLRVQLSPYLQNQLDEAARTGVPVLRPLSLAHPGDRNTWGIEDTFYFGPRMLVAPVLEDGARSRDVYLPRGVWLSWYTGEEFYGEQWVTIDAPLDQVPLFVRSGSVIPLRLDTVQTLSLAEDDDIRDASSDHTFHIRVFGRANGETTLPGGVPFEAEYVTLTDSTRFRFQASEEGVQHVFLELVGTSPLEVICEEETLPEDPTLFIRPLDGSESPAIRRLAASTLVRLPDSRSCTVVWY